MITTNPSATMLGKIRKLQRMEKLLEDILKWLIDDQLPETEKLYKDLHYYIDEIRTILKDK